MPNVRRTRAARLVPAYKRRRQVAQATELTARQWEVIRARVNDYAMWLHDAAMHKSASKADIAHAAALSSLQRVRRAIEAAIAPARAVLSVYPHA